MPMSLKSLRRDAQAILCPDCYTKYLTMIEPNIESMVLDSMHDWRATESYVTQMVMKHKGVFKSDYWFLYLGNSGNEKFPDLVDTEEFNRVRKWGFQKKIDYLHDNGILPKSCYKFLTQVNRVRNRIHDDPRFSKFSEQDLALFSIARAIAERIHDTIRFNMGEEISKRTRSDTEKAAEKLLVKFHMT